MLSGQDVDDGFPRPIAMASGVEQEQYKHVDRVIEYPANKAPVRSCCSLRWEDATTTDGNRSVLLTSKMSVRSVKDRNRTSNEVRDRRLPPMRKQLEKGPCSHQGSMTQV